MPRIVLTRADGTPLGDLDPLHALSVTAVEEVNGEHSLTIETTQELDKGTRVLWRDDRSVWHEFVVEGIEGEHSESGDAVHSYWCPWSLMHDLSGTSVVAMPGTGGSPAPASAALEAALGGTSRWQVGTVTRTSSGSASMWRMSGWEALQELVKVWGGELRATVDVGADGVTARRVDLLEHAGEAVATRRFDYGGDVSGIKRTVEDQLWTCRVIPLGKGEQTDSGGHGRKITIESVNDGKDWLQDDDVAEACRVPDGAGGWEYPVQYVENSACETPADLKAWAIGHLTEWTRPRASYEADVVQLSRAGMDAHGVALGDAVVVVDRGFGGEGIAVEGRALRIESDLLDPSQTKLTISNLTDTLGSTLAGLSGATAALASDVAAANAYQATAAYLSRLLDRLNGQINSTGGYTYITQGEGLRTYDRPVSDPLVGAEATQVVEIKGGNIRIANSRTSSGDWDWKTVLQSGHILADLVTAAKLTAGYIGSAQSGNYWDLDSGQLRMASTTLVGGQTVQQIADASSAAVGQTASEQLASAVQSINEDIEDIYSQLDGAIDMWFYQVNPSMSLPPVTTDPSDPDNTGWDTTAKKDAHVGDLYYNTVNGHSWRFIKESGAYSWSLITDSDVTRALEMASQAQATADAKRRVFVSTPYPPYDVGDLWVQGAAGGILKCVTAKADGYSYAASDWAAASKYTDDSALTSFLTNTYASDKAALEGLIDGKAETWYQSSDPSTGWTDAQKSSHQGDLWYKTTDQTTWRWSGSQWVAQNAPKEVFDAIDGKAQVFTSRPYPPYAIGDVWFEGTSGDIKVCVNGRTSGSYVTSDWEKRNKYTDDSALTAFMQGDYATDLVAITTQIDRKAETWYQEADPSRNPTTWDADEKAEHVGDLWYRTTDGTTWRWGGSSWVEQSTPTAVFDAIDGKAQIFTSTPAPPYSVGDLWFDSTASAIMVCVAANTTTTFRAADWAKRDKYTDDTAVNNLQLSATNLIRNGDFSNRTNFWTSQGAVREAVDDASFGHSMRVTFTGAGGSSHRVYASSFAHVVGRTYSISFWAKVEDESEEGAEEPTTNTIWANRGASTTVANSYVRGVTVTTEWQRYTGTITSASAGALNFWLGDAGTLHLANVMLVEGGKPMLDFSASPQDVPEAVSNYFGQTEIFNRLTDNGTVQGLFMDGSQLYVNADYIGTGIISDGSSGNYWNLDTGEMRMASALKDISATNLLRNGDASNGTTYWQYSGSEFGVYTDSNHGTTFRLVQSGDGGASNRIYPSLTSNFRHTMNTTYSVSFWARASNTNTIWCTQGVSMTEDHSYVFGERITTAWKRYSGTIDADSDGGLSIFLGSAGNLLVTHVMLVQGVAPMLDWSPDPRDGVITAQQAMTQERVFNALTNNGALQGLYMQNGQLYINASYLKSGKISADFVDGGTISGSSISLTGNGLRVTIDVDGTVKFYRYLSGTGWVLMSTLDGGTGLGFKINAAHGMDETVTGQLHTTYKTGSSTYSGDAYTGTLRTTVVTDASGGGYTTKNLTIGVVNGRIVQLSI